MNGPLGKKMWNAEIMETAIWTNRINYSQLYSTPVIRLFTIYTEYKQQTHTHNMFYKINGHVYIQYNYVDNFMQYFIV